MTEANKAVPEQSVAMSPQQLQAMMESLIRTMKEPSEADKVKAEKARQDVLRKELESHEIIKAQERSTEMKRVRCPHLKKYKGQTFWGWVGQVHSDEFVRPVCKYCQTEWPMFSAKFLPDGGKMGVNFEEWIDGSKEVLTDLHRKSFASGCPKNNCFICHPKQPAA